ncbi:MAG: hypothetical protein WC682_03355 [Parcubacteria group bacterium]
MKRTIRSVRSTLNFLLAMVELFVSIALTVSIFSSGANTNGGISDYITQIMDVIDDGTTVLIDSTGLIGPASFLVLVLGFMMFGMALFVLIPNMLEQSRERDEDDS